MTDESDAGPARPRPATPAGREAVVEWDDDGPTGGKVREFLIAETWTNGVPSFAFIEVAPTPDSPP